MKLMIAARLLVLLPLLTAPLPGEAQQATKVWRIGYPGASPTEARNLEALRQRLRELGYVDGTNLVIEARSAESTFGRLPALGAELVGLKPGNCATV